MDAELPLHCVVGTVVSEQHPRNTQKPGRRPSHADRVDGYSDRLTLAPTVNGAAAGTPREGFSLDEPLHPLTCGIVPPGIPSNVLAEVFEFDIPVGSAGSGEKLPPVEEDAVEKETSIRRWTSPEDGWGTNQPMQDLEKMPMGMPVTVGELADFLVCACDSGEEPSEGGDGGKEVERWAQSRSAASGSTGTPVAGDPREDEDHVPGNMLDWTLGQWRARRAKILGLKESEKPPPPTSTSDPEDHEARLFVEERPQGCVGPVLVHRVPQAPPRPILCTDDPEASLLKAVQLLLAYPELDALPIVSPVRCTVVAHLTLSYCLAYMMGRLRGSDLMPLASLIVSAQEGPSGGSPSKRFFNSSSCSPAAASSSSEGAGDGADGRESWAERKAGAPPEAPPPPPWVLGRSQSLRELLTFFARTHHSGVPVVEDENEGGVLGLLSRRDLLQFLDIAMQSAVRRATISRGNREEDGSPPSDEEEPVLVDLSAPVEGVLNILRRVRNEEEALARAAGVPATAPGPTDPAAKQFGIGASLIYEKELPLKACLLRLLNAENRELLFVKESETGAAPQLVRVVSVSDVWLMLIGSDSGFEEATAEGGCSAGSCAAEEPPLVSTDI